MLSPGWVNPHRYQVPTYIESKERLSPRERGVFLGLERLKDLFSTKKVLSEPNVKVVFHQTAVHVTPLSAWIIYPFGPLSAIPHAA